MITNSHNFHNDSNMNKNSKNNNETALPSESNKTLSRQPRHIGAKRLYHYIILILVKDRPDAAIIHA